MKKVRISLTKDSKSASFKVFNSPESAYVWLNDDTLREELGMDSSIGTVIDLKKGEVMEVEWMGCEYIVEDGIEFFKADFVRIGKTIKSPAFFTGGRTVIGIHEGWVVKEIPFKSCVENGTKIVRLGKTSKHKFDLSDLFKSRESYKSSENDEFFRESKKEVLN